MSRRKKLAFTLVGLCLSLGLGLLMVETGMRLLGLPFPETWAPPELARVRFDPEVGWVYAPNWSGVQRLPIPGERREVPMHFDELGARVGAPGVQRDPTRASLLLVGCSFTAGFGVRYEDSFAGQLAADPAVPLQVINLGVEAFGTDQALLILRRYLERFEVKAVVYTFITDHVARNHNYDRRVLFRQGRYLGTKPLFGLDPQGSLVLERPAMTYEELPDWRLRSALEFAWQKWGPRPGLDLTSALVRMMKQEVEAHGATFILITWDWYQDPQLIPEWPPFRDLGVNLIDTAVGAPPDWYDWHLAGDSHPNADAHARVAGLIREKLGEIGVLGR